MSSNWEEHRMNAIAPKPKLKEQKKQKKSSFAKRIPSLSEKDLKESMEFRRASRYRD